MPDLILNDATAVHWAVAGAGIGSITLLLLFLGNQRLGISTGLEDVCALVLNRPYFRRPSLSGRSWRLPMLSGLVLGGLISALSTGGWELTWALGRFDDEVGWNPAGKVLWMFVGGVFIGFGTRLAGGCTSGHGIFGISNLEIPSIISTVAFMAAGVVTTNLLYRVIL